MRHRLLPLVLVLLVTAPIGRAGDEDAGAPAPAAGAPREVATRTTWKPDAGPYEVRLVDETWHDATRDRDVPVRWRVPVGTEGRRSVVIASHGLGGSRRGLAWLGDHLASHGRIVLHLEHVGSNGTTVRREGQGRTTALDAVERPRDVAFALDRLAALDAAEDGAWSGRLDLARVAVAGHSYGAYTAMAAIGARVSFPGFRGEGAFHDARLKAAVVLSPQHPGRLGFTTGSWDDVTVPVLYATGSEDRALDTQDPARRREPFASEGASNPRWLCWIEGADHMTFGGRGRSPRNADHLRWLRQAVAAFLDATLDDDGAALLWLASGDLERQAGEEDLALESRDVTVAVAKPAAEEVPSTR